ncbi:UNVERIFIED_CONTAM: ToMV resistance protein Tm-2(2) [Sesamum radiatum]|uniref:ToMV resistance protein Tm-2(2) n=1 Tax=Sesamum radiatum TaxID=300843 RepID=A0AAW2TH93_SESRA
MAEAAVTVVINQAAKIAGNLIVRAGSRLYDLQENIDWIQNQMRTLHSYLKDANSKKSESHEVANLIVSIRDLAQDVEDILDTYLPEIESHNTKGPFHFLKHASCILCYGTKAHSFALEIKKIKKRAADIRESWENCRDMLDAKAATHSDDSDLWKVYVSHELTLEGLLLDIAKQVGLLKKEKEEERKEEEENLENKLHLFLQKKRYAILLDDIWDTETWDRLNDILLANSENGSRIIVTSRYVDVASEEALPPVLMDIGEKIVERCCGLPLGIVVAAGLLRVRKRSPHSWNEVLESISEGVENNCSKILALSYQDLPIELKPLFLYFGMFLEDHEYFVSELKTCGWQRN